MDLYALDEEIDAFEASLSLPDNASRLPNLITLAWYLRQRDSRRSLELIKEAIVLLNKLPDDTHHYNYFHARIKLIKAEIH